MSKDLSNYRKSYLLGELIESALPEDPLELFSDWFSNVEKIGEEIEPNAMSLAAINSENLPISRIVLLKKFDVEGFVFYTNYNSRKGKSISVNPAVCLSFFWSSVEQQVIINGMASKISGKESDTYFNSRPMGSQLGAIISNQSETIPSRKFLENKMEKLKLSSKKLQRPKNWGGYIVKPLSIEFWQGRNNRLHDRILYERSINGWSLRRLSP
tara:strand:+ start:21318 stop:21956 length:639 start_codon:yes stop_codon:yes gene_type:complete